MSNKLEFVAFPAVDNASEDGLLAMGGDLNLNTLVSAYSQGIFPWYNDDQPILWWSPDPRMVLFPNDVKVSRSLSKTIRKAGFKVTCNQDFDAVISACALRGQQDLRTPVEDTWIGDDMHAAYLTLHQQHYAHSIEVWQDNKLIGGLYGLAIGNVFFGESMFSRVSDASKVALVTLCKALSVAEFTVIDCQVANDHLFSLGAIEISRKQFLGLIQDAHIDKPIINFSNWFEQAIADDGITTR
ncbi:MAG: leucyl/phenylalanyl-tRNA--protein transferase [Arenicella sp.]|nr:leucyl/phenylalanyl-tRNA--protein transferase [Arenicella sp.]